MALEAVVYPQDPFIYCPNAFLRPDYAGYPFGLPFAKEEADPQDDNESSIFANDYSSGPADSHCAWPDVYHHHHNNTGSSTDTMVAVAPIGSDQEQLPVTAASGGGRRKRRRVKSMKNHEEIENQRMTHIAVERNRRKQMNEYLAVLRSLMPPSYSQRGDQASIIGGAINFVKELEQLLQSMEAQKFTNDPNHNNDNDNDLIGSHQPFSDFFSFPQYSTGSAGDTVGAASNVAADIEVTMVESHASLKIQSRRRPKQLLKLVTGLQAMRLGVLHLNVTSSGEMVLYSVNVKVEEGCHLTTVDEIAAAVDQMLRRIEEEASFS